MFGKPGQVPLLLPASTTTAHERPCVTLRALFIPSFVLHSTSPTTSRLTEVQHAHEPGYLDSYAAEEILLTGGEGDLRYTLNTRPVTSLSNSNRLTRSMEVSCPSEQCGDSTVLCSPQSPWGCPLRHSSVVPVMMLGEKTSRSVTILNFNLLLLLGKKTSLRERAV